MQTPFFEEIYDYAEKDIFGTKFNIELASESLH